MLERLGMIAGLTRLHSDADLDSQFYSALTTNRRKNLNGIYDVHTNIMQYPKIMQHTHAQWEQIYPEGVESKTQNLLICKVNGAEVDGNRPLMHEHDQRADSPFTPLPESYLRNFMIVDTYARGPPTSTFGYPGPPGSVVDVGPPGLTEVVDDVIAVLPDECRKAFFEAQEEERRWQSSWGTEEHDKMRAQVHITYNI